MLHEVSADQIMVIAEAVWHHSVGKQQQSRILNAAPCQNEMLGSHNAVLACHGTHT